MFLYVIPPLWSLLLGCKSCLQNNGHPKEKGRQKADSSSEGPGAARPVTLGQSSHRASLRARNAVATAAGVSGVRHPYEDLGDSSHTCKFCGASFWYTEHVRNTSLGERLRYNMCCRSGRVCLGSPCQPPQALKKLYQGRVFMENNCRYYSMFAMTSFGATVDKSVNDGSGPYVFKVSGQVSHFLGSLCPTVNSKPSFMRLYIYDTMHEVDNRLKPFSKDG
ncbi:hypothetical protein SSX86_024673 [Deinandra increscens subsp. villosa]|uniref:Uncharacterized protein n=1 Tax=Deinandra increscens subsp. villosa TaxID=3103831 RepID=A0AAP0CB35_9ASTR